jgi:hypothetical protein
MSIQKQQLSGLSTKQSGAGPVVAWQVHEAPSKVQRLAPVEGSHWATKMCPSKKFA